MNKKDKQDKLNAIFVDLDLLNKEPCIHSEKNIEEIRKNYKRYRLRSAFNEHEMFDKLNDDEVLTMDNWDHDQIVQIDHIGHRNYVTDFIFMTTTAFDSKHFHIMCKLRSVYRANLLIYSEEDYLPDKINEYMETHSEYENFAIVSKIDMRKAFPEHAVWIRGNTPDFDEIKSKIHRFLYCNPMEYFAWYTDTRDNDEEALPFYKVIFLDIDGVLNDEGEEYAKGVKIDPVMVKRLGKIVEATDADVVLSSSWKRAYKRFVENGYKDNEDKALPLLYNSLKEQGITIRGITSISQESGSCARPLEIREWLMRYYNIFSYVILEDDTFWQWGFLQRNVVSTLTVDPSRDPYHQIIKGLTDEHVEKAIAILNERSAFPYN